VHPISVTAMHNLGHALRLLGLGQLQLLVSLLHLSHPFARWARRARRRSPAAAAKHIWLPPVYDPLRGVSFVEPSIALEEILPLKVSVSTCSHFVGYYRYKEAWRLSRTPIIMTWIGYLESPTLEQGAPWMGWRHNGNGVNVPPFCQMIHLIVYSRRSSCSV